MSAAVEPAVSQPTGTPRGAKQSAAVAPAPLLLRALRREPVERVPVWFMRQAGRSLPEYRALRTGGSLIELCENPDLATEVTLQPVRRHGVDAAILFSDIVLPLHAIGVGVEIVAGVGPVIERPIRTAADLARLRQFEPESDAPYLAETVRQLVTELPVPLIGFAGAPFTLASYLVEGGPSKAQAMTKALMLSEPALWTELLQRLADIAAASLRAQVEAGAQAVQIFDSWIGALSAPDYEQFVAPAVRRLFAAIQDLDVPTIIFGLGTGHLLESMAASGASAVGLDWRVPLVQGASRLGEGVALQGNLDPAACLAPWEVAHQRTLDVLEQAPKQGYVFNLGHGVMPETPPETLTRIVELVREKSSVPATS
jgi:uroporphyrinogen decarboxylase